MAGNGWEWEVTADKFKGHFGEGGDKKVLILDWWVVQLSKFTKNHRLVYLRLLSAYQFLGEVSFSLRAIIIMIILFF